MSRLFFASAFAATNNPSAGVDGYFISADYGAKSDRRTFFEFGKSPLVLFILLLT
jgi:hypothetical protein